jgi:hypothetical protein
MIMEWIDAKEKLPGYDKPWGPGWEDANILYSCIISTGYGDDQETSAVFYSSKLGWLNYFNTDPYVPNPEYPITDWIYFPDSPYRPASKEKKVDWQLIKGD